MIRQYRPCGLKKATLARAKKLLLRTRTYVRCAATSATVTAMLTTCAVGSGTQLATGAATLTTSKTRLTLIDCSKLARNSNQAALVDAARAQQRRVRVHEAPALRLGPPLRQDHRAGQRRARAGRARRVVPHEALDQRVDAGRARQVALGHFGRAVARAAGLGGQRGFGSLVQLPLLLVGLAVKVVVRAIVAGGRFAVMGRRRALGGVQRRRAQDTGVGGAGRGRCLRGVGWARGARLRDEGTAGLSRDLDLDLARWWAMASALRPLCRNQLLLADNNGHGCIAKEP